MRAGTTVTFTNVGDIPHTATAFDRGKIGDWDTGALNKGESKEITFKEPGTYFYIALPIRGCTVRWSSNSWLAYRAGGRANRMPRRGAAASGGSLA